MKALAMTDDERSKLIRYKGFLKKTGCTILESRAWHTSMYMDFSRVYECQRNGDYCLNYHNSTYNLIRQRERRHLYLYEAVTSVKPFSALQHLFDKFCETKLDPELLRLSEKDFGISTSDVPIVEDVQKDYRDDSINADVYAIASFRFAADADADLKALLEDFIDEAENINYGLCKFGREPSIGMKQLIDGRELDMYFITFEAKYNSFQFEFADWLHHYTSVDSLHTINKNGLVPSSANVRFAYEDRVYLFNKATFSDIAGFAQEKAEDEKLAGIAILKISSKKLQEWKDYRDGIAKFYVDTKITNFEMKDARAVYTYDSIPRDLIDNEIVVYDADTNFTLRNGRKQDLRNF